MYAKMYARMYAKMYDLIVAGGGTAGSACAYIAAKQGLKTLVIEKNIHLGGTITSGFVTPAMKTDYQNVNCDFFNDLVKKMGEYNAQITYSDGNRGWFNPEILKIVFDEMLTDAGCEILFGTEVVDAKVDNDKVISIETKYKTLSSYFESKFFVDATGDGNFSLLCKNEILSDENSTQAMTLRFLISGIDLEKFKDWLIEMDKDRDVTNFAYIDGALHLTTAYTWDSRDWGLAPVFRKALQAGDLEESDTAYFQLFTVAGMPNTVTMNCPRILVESGEWRVESEVDHPAPKGHPSTGGESAPLSTLHSPLSQSDTSQALIQARKRIYRLHRFCKKYFPGFENSFISNMADLLGVRESRRVKGQYVYTLQDIAEARTFEHVACVSDYPVDVHSSTKDRSVLEHVKHTYQLPLEALKSNKYDNLYMIGRCLSAEFKAQAALRIQPCCFSMGEAVAKDIKKRS